MHSAEGFISRHLGRPTVTSDGSGYASGIRQAAPLTLIAQVKEDTIERDQDGAISFAYCFFEAHYSQVNWNDADLDIMYMDRGVQAGINLHLATTFGFCGEVGWSEQGRQESGTADFDIDYVLIDEMWPHLRQRAGRASDVLTSPQKSPPAEDDSALTVQFMSLARVWAWVVAGPMGNITCLSPGYETRAEALDNRPQRRS